MLLIQAHTLGKVWKIQQYSLVGVGSVSQKTACNFICLFNPVHAGFSGHVYVQRT
jgi:hypothetical protein